MYCFLHPFYHVLVNKDKNIYLESIFRAWSCHHRTRCSASCCRRHSGPTDPRPQRLWAVPASSWFGSRQPAAAAAVLRCCLPASRRCHRASRTAAPGRSRPRTATRTPPGRRPLRPPVRPTPRVVLLEPERSVYTSSVLRRRRWPRWRNATDTAIARHLAWCNTSISTVRQSFASHLFSSFINRRQSLFSVNDYYFSDERSLLRRLGRGRKPVALLAPGGGGCGGCGLDADAFEWRHWRRGRGVVAPRSAPVRVAVRRDACVSLCACVRA